MTKASGRQSDLPAKPWQGRLLDARLQILDRQLHDHNDDPIGTVDDIELEGISIGDTIAPETPAPVVKALVSGPVLLTRIFGGHPPRGRRHFIDWRLVDRLGVVIKLHATDLLSEMTWAEQWLCSHVIGRIPGGRHAAE